MHWGPRGAHRIWKLQAPAYGLHDAPAAFRNALQRFLLRAEDSSALAALKFQVSTFGPRVYLVCRGSRSVAGTLTTHIDDVLGCGGPDTLLEARKYSARPYRGPKVSEQCREHVGL